MKMVKTLLKTSASKKFKIDPEGLQATMNMAWKTHIEYVHNEAQSLRRRAKNQHSKSVTSLVF